jgi:hypothetical protein
VAALRSSAENDVYSSSTDLSLNSVTRMKNNKQTDGFNRKHSVTLDTQALSGRHRLPKSALFSDR